jgi:IS605 OrfB family transposase
VYSSSSKEEQLKRFVKCDILLKELEGIQLVDQLDKKKFKSREDTSILQSLKLLLGHYKVLENDLLVDFLPKLISSFERKIENSIEGIDTQSEEYIENDKESYITHLLPPTFLGMPYMDLFVKMNIPSYRLISSQVAQQTIKKIEDAYDGFFELLRGGFKASVPGYNRTNKFNLIFQKDLFKVEKDKVRLSLGREFTQKFTENFGDSVIDKKSYFLSKQRPHNCNKKIKTTVNTVEYSKKFIYIKVSKKILRDKNISEIELVPSQYVDRNVYSLNIKFTTRVSVAEQNSDMNKISIDFGIKNIATLYSPVLQKPIIYDGSYLVSINKQINSRIDKIKSDIKTKYKATTCEAIQRLFTKKKNIIDDYFNKISASIMKLSKKNSINEIVLGYNKNWKHKCDMGNDNNRKFYEIPYSRLIKMLFYKGETNNIKVSENEESYTSKCDALALEEIEKQNVYLGKRIKRGLFQSSKGVLINADVNGAINILRKYVKSKHHTLQNLLGEIIESTPMHFVCNPVRIGIQQITADVLPGGKGVMTTLQFR